MKFIISALAIAALAAGCDRTSQSNDENELYLEVCTVYNGVEIHEDGIGQRLACWTEGDYTFESNTVTGVVCKFPNVLNNAWFDMGVAIKDNDEGQRLVIWCDSKYRYQENTVTGVRTSAPIFPEYLVNHQTQTSRR